MRNYLTIAAMVVTLGSSSGIALAQSGSEAGNNAVGQPGSNEYYSASDVNASRLRMQHPPGSSTISESRSYSRTGMNSAYVRSGAVSRASGVGY